MPRSHLTSAEQESLRNGLVALLQEIEAGRMTAGASLIAMLRGAVTALDVSLDPIRHESRLE